MTEETPAASSLTTIDVEPPVFPTECTGYMTWKLKFIYFIASQSREEEGSEKAGYTMSDFISACPDRPTSDELQMQAYDHALESLHKMLDQTLPLSVQQLLSGYTTTSASCSIKPHDILNQLDQVLSSPPTSTSSSRTRTALEELVEASFQWTQLRYSHSSSTSLTKFIQQVMAQRQTLNQLATTVTNACFPAISEHMAVMMILSQLPSRIRKTALFELSKIRSSPECLTLRWCQTTLVDLDAQESSVLEKSLEAKDPMIVENNPARKRYRSEGTHDNDHPESGTSINDRRFSSESNSSTSKRLRNYAENPPAVSSSGAPDEDCYYCFQGGHKKLLCPSRMRDVLNGYLGRSIESQKFKLRPADIDREVKKVETLCRRLKVDINQVYAAAEALGQSERHPPAGRGVSETRNHLPPPSSSSLSSSSMGRADHHDNHPVSQLRRMIHEKKVENPSSTRRRSRSPNREPQERRSLSSAGRKSNDYGDQYDDFHPALASSSGRSNNRDNIQYDDRDHGYHQDQRPSYGDSSGYHPPTTFYANSNSKPIEYPAGESSEGCFYCGSADHMKLLCPTRIMNIKRGFIQRTAGAEKRIQISEEAVGEELSKLRELCRRKYCLTPEAEALLRHEPSSSSILGSQQQQQPTTSYPNPTHHPVDHFDASLVDPRTAKPSLTTHGTGASFVVPTPARSTTTGLAPAPATAVPRPQTTTSGGNLNIHPDILRYLESRKKEERAAGAAAGQE